MPHKTWTLTFVEMNRIFATGGWRCPHTSRKFAHLPQSKIIPPPLPHHQLIKKFPQQNPIISWLRSKLKVKLIIWSFSACQRGISYIYWKKRSISGHLLILKKNIKILMTIFFFSSGVWAKGYHF